MILDFYIGNQKIDIGDDFQIIMNYTLENLEKPATINNQYSQTISIRGTENNNKVFGDIFKLDREQLYNDNIYTGVYFNPISRTPYSLYRNGELVNSGYMQLNDIEVGNEIIYKITLYGGLGDFFYNLSSRNDKKYTLSDLDFGTDLSYTINASTIYDAWQHLENETSGDTTKWSTINFIPTYQGEYEDFSNDKAVINTYQSTQFPSIDYTKDGKTYTPYYGYYFAELAKGYNEWEIRDLRSYKQHPALRVRRFFDAICNPNNNGGYNVDLDPDFFNSNNPYYQKSWFLLPNVRAKANNFDTIVDNFSAGFSGNTSFSNIISETITNQKSVTNFVVDNYTDADGYISLKGDYNPQSIVNFEMVYNLFCNYNGSADDLYLSYWKGITGDGYASSSMGYTDFINYWSCVVVYTQAVNRNGDVIAQSDGICYTNDLETATFDINNVEYNNLPANITYVKGNFIEIGGGSQYIFSATNTENAAILRLENIDINQDFKIEVITRKLNSKNFKNYLPNSIWQTADNRLWDGDELVATQGIYCNLLGAEVRLELPNDFVSLSNMNITQEQVLGGELSPADLLLSYTKQFGLYYIKDDNDKTIKIRTRNNFFNGSYYNVDNLIDRHNGFSISPTTFSKKWYSLVCPSLSTSISDTYKAKYKYNFGEQVINTNYTFNDETNDIYKDNKLQNVITYTDNSLYYNHFISKTTNQPLPSFANEGYEIKLYNNNDIEDSVNQTQPSDIVGSVIHFNNYPSTDVLPKIALFKDGNNGSKTLSEVSVSMVMYNGNKSFTDVNGTPINYTISDDTNEMFDLNDNKPCYLVSQNETDANGKTIMRKTNSLPQFTRYNVQGNTITESLDFGVPYETYTNLTYQSGSTLYNNYWKGLYTDQCSTNCRRVNCKMLFKESLLQVSNRLLRNVYCFDNGWWILNKIKDIDIVNPMIGSVEFIKIGDITNYYSQKLYAPDDLLSTTTSQIVPTTSQEIATTTPEMENTTTTTTMESTTTTTTTTPELENTTTSTSQEIATTTSSEQLNTFNLDSETNSLDSVLDEYLNS